MGLEGSAVNLHRKLPCNLAPLPIYGPNRADDFFRPLWVLCGTPGMSPPHIWTLGGSGWPKVGTYRWGVVFVLRNKCCKLEFSRKINGWKNKKIQPGCQACMGYFRLYLVWAKIPPRGHFTVNLDFNFRQRRGKSIFPLNFGGQWSEKAAQRWMVNQVFGPWTDTLNNIPR